MAAQIVAREIDYALYRIDLSQVFDKFIGESEKKLAALFDEAERSRVALFFDEADSCFGKRTELRDSHDRYANMGTNFLLQRLESFSGLAILATNFASNIDDAFVRRLRVKAEFTAPGPGERRKIWTLLLPPEKDRAEDIDLSVLADAFEIVGGEIRNSIYTAHLLAAAEDAPLAMRHCVRGLWRELGKIGRLPDRSRLGVWRNLI
jgi:SpoVK/Ycf46/Vps4 family AAA+-type ATPase